MKGVRRRGRHLPSLLSWISSSPLLRALRKTLSSLIKAVQLRAEQMIG